MAFGSNVLGVDGGEEMTQASPQTMTFEAETGQLLQLMISSVYSSKEIFLRELISNASGALDKLRFEALTKTDLIPEGETLSVTLEADRAARTLTIEDNGIGMSKAEVLSNIGTIAKSGTRELLQNLKSSGAENLPDEMIGQFGVGFYSVFMVAKKVELETRRAGESDSTLWSSDGGGAYRIEAGSREKNGTRITLYLRDIDKDNGLDDFTDEWVLKGIVKEHSDYVRYPVRLLVTREKEVDGEKKTETEYEIINSQTAIWLKPDNDVSEEERTEFYKHISHDWTKPLTHITMHAEGRFEYRALLFIPARAPMDLFYRSFERGLQLYVRNVKILDRCEDLMPDFLRFVKGVVDSPDMPLNLSREMVQFSRQTAQIRNVLSKKVLDALAKLKTDRYEEYLAFYKEVGAVLKEGVTSAPEFRDKIVDLLLFESSRDKEKRCSLKAYVERMKEGQGEIYYLTGESRKAVEGSPHLEAALKRGYEVLFMTDPVDEFIIPALAEYDGKKLKSVGKGEVSFDSEEDVKTDKQMTEEKKKGFEPFLKAIQKELDESVSEVRLSNRLTTSAVCLVGDETSFSPHVERLMAQNNVNLPKHKRVLELNPEHEIIQKLKARFDVRPNDLSLGDHAQLLYGQALLAEGSIPSDPAAFSKLLANFMAGAL
jgi:molecular chaperone HtpG